MAIVRRAGVEAGLRRLDPAVRAILFYGGDETRVAELAAMAVKRIAGSLDDPFNVQRLQEAELAKSPGRLIDEVQSLSLLGGRRVIWVEGADAQFMAAVAPVLSAEVSGNLIVAEAGNLTKSSALRALFEKSDRAWIVPVYEASVAEAQEFLASAFARKGLAADQAACALLVQSYGTDLGLLRQEVEKLSLYCLGAKAVTVEDVEGVSASGGELHFDDVIDAALGGDMERTETLLVRMGEGGVDPGQVAGACLRHVVRLQEISLAVERGQSADQAVRSARPAIFFKRNADVLLQLRIWSLPELTGLAAALAEVIRQGRLSQGLGAVVGARGLLSVARQAKALRTRLE
jgi:DNA polymerase-3 subunit delta